MTGGVRSGLCLASNKNAVSFSAVSGALMQFMVARVAGDLAQISWQQSFKNRQTAGNSAVFIRPTRPNRPLLV